VQGIDTLSETEEMVELSASLVPTSADPEELDAVVATLEKSDLIQNATWTVSALS
jgi:putative Mg2+ transporter-C (MgtC) family protein